MDYKSTLNLPKTGFPMRGNLPQKEPERYRRWFENGVYEKMKSNRRGEKLFTLHDGPPYANGKIHIGHALNKVLKDMKIGKAKKEELPKTKIRELCRRHAAKYVEVQKEGFKALGVIADWEKPYVTMDFAFEAEIYRTLCKVASKDWSWAERTALAEAEVEYEEKEDFSVYVAFELSDKAKQKLGHPEAAALVIWTTTPWTLPANVGISLNPEEMYVLTKEGYIVAEKLFDDLQESGVVEGPIEMRIPAKDLEGENAIKFDETVVRLDLLPNAEEFVGKHIFEANEEILKLLGSALLKVERFTHSYPHCWRSHTPLIFRATRQWFISIDGKPEGEQKSLRQIALDEIEKTKFHPEWGRNRLNSMVEGEYRRASLSGQRLRP